MKQGFQIRQSIGRERKRKKTRE